MPAGVVSNPRTILWEGLELVPAVDGDEVDADVGDESVLEECIVEADDSIAAC